MARTRDRTRTRALPNEVCRWCLTLDRPGIGPEYIQLFPVSRNVGMKTIGVVLVPPVSVLWTGNE